MRGWQFFFENYYPNSKVEGFYIKKLSLEFLIFLRHNNFFLKMKTFFRHKAKLLVHHILWMFVKFWNLLLKIQEFHFIDLFFCTMKTWNSVFFVAFSMKFLKNFKFYFFHTWNYNYWSTIFLLFLITVHLKSRIPKKLVFGRCHTRAPMPENDCRDFQVCHT